MAACKGDHSLVIIYAYGPEMECEVVRWCAECGAITIDLDVDGRVASAYQTHGTAEAGSNETGGKRMITVNVTDEVTKNRMTAVCRTYNRHELCQGRNNICECSCHPPLLTQVDVDAAYAKGVEDERERIRVAIRAVERWNYTEIQFIAEPEGACVYRADVLASIDAYEKGEST
jgi:hypothetical protein